MEDIAQIELYSEMVSICADVLHRQLYGFTVATKPYTCTDEHGASQFLTHMCMGMGALIWVVRHHPQATLFPMQHDPHIFHPI